MAYIVDRNGWGSYVTLCFIYILISRLGMANESSNYEKNLISELFLLY